MARMLAVMATVRECLTERRSSVLLALYGFCALGAILLIRAVIKGW